MLKHSGIIQPQTDESKPEPENTDEILLFHLWKTISPPDESGNYRLSG